MEEALSNTLPRGGEKEGVGLENKLAIIMRGLPGSGKSYWIKTFLAQQPQLVGPHTRANGYFSTDSYFYQGKNYRFDSRKLSEYHQRNLNGFIQALSNNEPIVICDNTNLACWEYMAYESAAKAMGYEVRIVLMGQPKDSAHQALCAKRNSHGVTLQNIKRMAQNFEPR